jgi:hypothetical protein
MAVQLDKLSDRDLLNLRLCELPVKIQGTFLQHCIRQLYRELAARSIRFRPHTWLSEEWFTPDGVAGFAIPFYLTHPRLIKLERSLMLEAEGASQRECMRILRHETGHAISNAFRLHTRRSWSDVFGPFHATYPESYQPKADSRDYVLNLDAWYGQSHPAEDFAETFAVWLKPRSRWKRDYESWGAIRKLNYVDKLIGEIAEKSRTKESRREVEPIAKLQTTLSEHYQIKRAYYTVTLPESYDRNLYRVFTDGGVNRKSSNAANFLRQNRRKIGGLVSRGTGMHPYTVNHVLKHMIMRARELKLGLAIPESEALQLSVVALTTQVMQIIGEGYHRIPL